MPEGTGATAQLDGKRVIIVEDEAMTVLGLGRALARVGLSVMALAWSGEEAIAAVLRERPDIVLMDINLGGGTNGIEATRRILAEFDTCVVMLTAYPDYEEAARKAGACGYVLKPVTSDILIRKLIEAWGVFSDWKAAKPP